MTMQRPRFWNVLVGALSALLLLALIPSSAAAQTNSSQESDREKKVHLSLYYENFKNENYEAALSDLRWILEHAPTFYYNDDTHFERAVTAYGALAKAAQSESAKQAYLDSAFALIERAVPVLQQAGAEVDPYVWTLKKGRFIQQHLDALPEMKEEMLAAYQKAYEMAPDKIDPYYLDRILRAYVVNDQKEQAVALLDKLEKQRSDDEKVAKLIDEWSARVFTKPAERIAYLEGEVQENPGDTAATKQLFQLYMRQNMRQKALQLADRILQRNPSPGMLRTIARMRLEDGQVQKALELYQQALQAAPEDASAELYYNIGLAQRQIGQYSKARTSFRQAIEANPNFGRAYIAIGDLYASAVSQCGGKLELADRAVYWAAVDKYQKAKSVDPSVASIANQKISTYRQYFPTQETLFFQDMQEGQSYTIDYGCYAWIGETTTVRTS